MRRRVGSESALKTRFMFSYLANIGNTVNWPALSATGQDAKVSHGAKMVRYCSEIRPHGGHAKLAATGHKRPMCDLETPESACARFVFLLSDLGRFDPGEAPSQPVIVECWCDGAQSRKCCPQSPATDRAMVAPNRR